MPEIESFDIAPSAVAVAGTVKLRAKLPMPPDDLERGGFCFRFIDPNGETINYEREHKATVVGTWTADKRKGSRLTIEHGEFRAQLIRTSDNSLARDVLETITIVWTPALKVRVDPATVVEGDPATAEAEVDMPAEDFKNFDIDIAWFLDTKPPIASDNPIEFPIDTTGLQPGSHTVTAKMVGKDGQVIKGKGDTEVTAQNSMTITPRALSRTDTLKVALQRSSSSRTKDQVLWSLIRDRTTALSFTGGGYKTFIDKVLCDPRSVQNPLVRRRLVEPVKNLGINAYGRAGYDLLKTATEIFLLLNCGVALDRTFEGTGFDPDSEAGRLGERISVTELRNRLTRYFQSGRFPYLDRVIDAAFPEGTTDVDSIFCPDALTSRASAPCLLELIWSYWHEEGMLVQTMNAISRRFQNVRGPGDRDPLAHLEIDPLRPLNNLLWGYIQDEQNLLTVKRRAYEYDHHYGLATYGKAVPPLRPADSRSKFLEGFHNLLHVTSVFYKEDNDTTVIADGFPLLNALREVHLLLAQGAHNQFGDLPWTARAEMLMQQWMLSQPQMREFLQSRPMVPYKEPWMGQVDTMKSLQGWSDIAVTHFRDLGAYGEQILLSVRYGDWIDINDEDSAKNWARYWRPEIQSYVHAYRTVTGIDLTNPDTVDYTMPAVHLQKRLAMQRAR
ncbi:hypothetical protein [Bradyrhizobium cenepequi]